MRLLSRGAGFLAALALAPLCSAQMDQDGGCRPDPNPPPVAGMADDGSRVSPCGGVLTAPEDPGCIATHFSGGNGFAGNTFDITPSVDMQLTGMDLHHDTVGEQLQFDVYYCAGSCVGYESDPSHWTLMSSASATSAGLDQPTHIDISGSGVTLQAGQQYGIYVDLSNYASILGVLTYTNGGPTTVSNGEITLTTNTGQQSPAFSGSFFPRAWNGILYYDWWYPWPIAVYNSRTAWQSAAGTPTHTENFSGFPPLQDTSFEPGCAGGGPVDLNGSMIVVTSGAGSCFRNVVDSFPYLFSQHNGTTHASCYVNNNFPFPPNPNQVEITITFDSPVTAWGADFYDATTGEGARIDVYDGSTLLGVVFPGSGTTFCGFTTSTPATKIVLRPVNFIFGSMGEGFGLDDLAQVVWSPPCTPPVVYCTAGQGTSSGGCFASITTSAPAHCPMPSANNYDVVVNSAEPNKPGIIFYGYSTASIPFSTGTLCVQPPLKRTPPQGTGGSGTCSGSMSLRINDPAGLDHSSGTVVYFQGWYRDQQGIGTDLSDAIEVEYD